MLARLGVESELVVCLLIKRKTRSSIPQITGVIPYWKYVPI